MTTQRLYRPMPSDQKVEEDSLFSGIWIRWSALNKAEQFVCANIVLLPIWWAAGLFSYMPELILLAVVVYEWRRYGKLQLKRPSLAVIALFAFFAYGYLDQLLLFYNEHPSAELPLGAIRRPDDLIQSALGFSFPCLVWYIQSKDIKVRPEIVAWACSVSVAQMLVSWLLVQFVFPGAFDPPPRSLYGLLTGKNAVYLTGSGRGNYMTFYEDGRLQFFFNGYQSAAVFLSFVSLLAVDIKNRFWSLLLLAACIFLAFSVGSRSVLLAFPAALFIRFLFMTGKVAGAWILFALIAMISFATLSLPPVTDLAFNTYTGTTTAVGNLRPGSTEVRSNVYEQTLERIPDKPFFGHKVDGPATINENTGGDGPKIGTHSFILGNLLYKGGLVGTSLFMTFWISLIVWLYNTRAGRPLCWLSIMILISIVLCLTEYNLIMTMSTVVCLLLRRPARKSLRRSIA